MRGKLEYDLPEEEEEFYTALEGWKYKAILYAVDQWLRGLRKHQDVDKIGVEEVRDKLHAEAAERGVEI